jgi:integrase/recombinase XerD
MKSSEKNRTNTELVSSISSTNIPSAVFKAGGFAQRSFAEFFTAGIRNRNTREAYFRAIHQFFLWLENNYSSLQLAQITPMVIARYIESHPGAPLTRNQHLAALRGLFAWLESASVISENPTASVRGIKYRQKRGKTPILTDSEISTLLASIDLNTLIGLRDRALISVMFFSFARVSAVLGMNVGDYYSHNGGNWLRLYEKGGKAHTVPAHPEVNIALDAYLKAGGHKDTRDAPLFQTQPGFTDILSGHRLRRHEAWAMIKRRALVAGISAEACNHTFRASGITNYLKNGGNRDTAQRIAAHEDIRTTALYDRRDEAVARLEIEKIALRKS